MSCHHQAIVGRLYVVLRRVSPMVLCHLFFFNDMFETEYIVITCSSSTKSVFFFFFLTFPLLYDFSVCAHIIYWLYLLWIFLYNFHIVFYILYYKLIFLGSFQFSWNGMSIIKQAKYICYSIVYNIVSAYISSGSQGFPFLKTFVVSLTISYIHFLRKWFIEYSCLFSVSISLWLLIYD